MRHPCACPGMRSLRREDHWARDRSQRFVLLLRSLRARRRGHGGRRPRMSSQKKDAKPIRPAQTQPRQPGREHKMLPRPKVAPPEYRGSGKLKDKVALITGGDSGIGRAVAVLFAREGADIAISYLNEHKDAKETVRLVKQEGRKCVAFAGDIGEESVCRKIVSATVRQF